MPRPTVSTVDDTGARLWRHVVVDAPDFYWEHVDIRLDGLTLTVRANGTSVGLVPDRTYLLDGLAMVDETSMRSDRFTKLVASTDGGPLVVAADPACTCASPRSRRDVK